MAKEYLSQRDIPFVEKDILNDKSAMDELLKIGVLTTPVTVIDGEVVVGFDHGRFAASRSQAVRLLHSLAVLLDLPFKWKVYNHN